MQATKPAVVLLSILLFPVFVGLSAVSVSARADQRGGTAFTCEERALRLTARELSKLVAKRTPILPPGMLHNSELHGTVTVDVCIDQAGAVSAIRAVEGHPLAISPVIESVRGWSFVPYKHDGEARSVFGRLRVKYDFRAQAQQSPQLP